MYNRKEFLVYIVGQVQPILVHGDLTFKQAAMNAMDIALFGADEDILCVKDAKEVKSNEPCNTIVKSEHTAKRFVVTTKPNEVAIEGRVNSWNFKTKPALTWY